MRSSTSRFVGVAIIFAVLVLLVVILLTYNWKSKTANSERFYADVNQQQLMKPTSVGSLAPSNPDAAAGLGGPVAPSDANGNEIFNPVSFNPVGKDWSGADGPTPSCFPRDRVAVDELLPKDAANSRWAQMNPAGQGEIGTQNYLTAGLHMGINTQGQTMKNANLQLRSEPPNPQNPVSVWNMSTIEYDPRGGRNFEIGSGM